MGSQSVRASRFSLLLLEEGELLLSDVAAQYQFIPDPSVPSTHHPLLPHPQPFAASSNPCIRGRLKIATRSIFFDSDDWRHPIIRIPFLSVRRATLATDPPPSKCTDHIQTDHPHNDASVVVFATDAIFQRELAIDHPYVQVTLEGSHVFTPLWSSVGLLLDDINVLLQIASTSSRRNRDHKLRQLVRERESRVPFDITLLEHGVKESAMMDSPASAVYTLSRAPGRFCITVHNIYFMPIHGDSSNAVQRIPIGSISSLRRLKHGCLDAALEIGSQSSQTRPSDQTFSTFMISFESRHAREKALTMLIQIIGDRDVQMFERRDLEVALNKWRRGQMSNFEYLMYINMAAGRSFNDLSQYPVFPWILQDYASDSLDLTKKETFRDLTKPIGALEPKRLATLNERYHEMPPPRFFYGTHYSTPAYTINYLVRAAPAAMLRLQNGRFDTPDRLFNSIAATWKGVLSNPGDVKELIPEFFATDYSKGNFSGIVSNNSTPGEFLDNVLGLDLGTRQDGKRVDDVELPPWANGSSELFVRRNREALESEFVSLRLHAWIDLVFGIKSRKPEHFNVFYTDVALPHSIDAKESSRLSAEEMAQVETVYLEFGRTPQQVFAYPHPPRFGDVHSTDFGQEELLAEYELAHLSPSRKSELNEPESVEFSKLGPENRQDNNQDISVLTESAAAITPDSPSLSPISTSTWGAQSRRKDSVLTGASDHILVLYEPSEAQNGMGNTQKVSASSVRSIVTHGEKDDTQTIILDVCLVSDSAPKVDSSWQSSVDNDPNPPVLCTAWSDGHLKVHSEKTTLRSRHIGDVSSIICIPPDIIACGTMGGSISLYHIETGRTENVQPAAHDAQIQTLEYLSESQILISGSMDASVKVWRLELQRHRSTTLRLIQELDAESSVEDISCAIEGTGRPGNSNTEAEEAGDNLLIATATSDGQLLAWELDLQNSEEEFREPTWRCENSAVRSNFAGTHSARRTCKVTWLYQGKSRKRALCTIHDAENCLRVWSLDEEKMASAEVFLSVGAAKCVTSCSASRTVLVGGNLGHISEFDSTGLCLGRVSVGSNEIRSVLLPDNGGCMYVLVGEREVFRVNR